MTVCFIYWTIIFDEVPGNSAWIYYKYQLIFGFECNYSQKYYSYIFVQFNLLEYILKEVDTDTFHTCILILILN